MKAVVSKARSITGTGNSLLCSVEWIISQNSVSLSIDRALDFFGLHQSDSTIEVISLPPSMIFRGGNFRPARRRIFIRRCHKSVSGVPSPSFRLKLIIPSGNSGGLGGRCLLHFPTFGCGPFQNAPVGHRLVRVPGGVLYAQGPSFSMA